MSPRPIASSTSSKTVWALPGALPGIAAWPRYSTATMTKRQSISRLYWTSCPVRSPRRWPWPRPPNLPETRRISTSTARSGPPITVSSQRVMGWHARWPPAGSGQRRCACSTTCRQPRAISPPRASPARSRCCRGGHSRKSPRTISARPPAEWKHCPRPSHGCCRSGRWCWARHWTGSRAIIRPDITFWVFRSPNAVCARG